MLPMQSVDLAIEEMRFARKQLGMKGGFLRPNPYNGRMANHPDYDPFWAEAQELDFSIGFHEGASGGMPTVGVDRFEGRGARHMTGDARSCWGWPASGAHPLYAPWWSGLEPALPSAMSTSTSSSLALRRSARR